MKITREQIMNIIKEEYTSAMTNEGSQDEGLRSMLADFIAQEVTGWHDVAKATLHKHVAENGFDISDIVFNALGGGMQEELAHSDIGASRGPQEVFDDANNHLHEAHKDLQMLSLHLKNGGFDVQPTEDLLKTVERTLFALDDLPKQDVEKLLSLKGPLEKGTRD
jgi:hypothetical protein